MPNTHRSCHVFLTIINVPRLLIAHDPVSRPHSSGTLYAYFGEVINLTRLVHWYFFLNSPWISVWTHGWTLNGWTTSLLGKGQNPRNTGINPKVIFCSKRPLGQTQNIEKREVKIPGVVGIFCMKFSQRHYWSEPNCWSRKRRHDDVKGSQYQPCEHTPQQPNTKPNLKLKLWQRGQRVLNKVKPALGCLIHTL